MPPTKLRRTCIEGGCNNLTPPGRTRCTPHQQQHDHNRNQARPWYQTPEYRATAGAIRDNPTLTCWICGQHATNNDPLTADHINPATTHHGTGPILPAHRSCNSSRQATPATDTPTTRQQPDTQNQPYTPPA